MNNQPEKIELGDLVSIDRNGYLVKATSPVYVVGTCMDNYGRTIAVNQGQAISIQMWHNSTICIICKRTNHNLSPDYQYHGLKFDHPFLKDNLEYLEIKYEQSQLAPR